MAHSHEPVVHHDREVIDNRGTGAGLMIAIAALIAIVVIGLAVLWAAPWDDDGGGATPNVPDVTDNSGGGVPVPGDGDAGGGDGGGTGGGEQPAQ